LNAPAGAGGARSESENFTYDFLDRFVGHSVSGFTDTSALGANTNSYDVAGNITSKAGLSLGYATANTQCASGTPAGTSCNRLVNIAGNAPLYDASGNITRYTRPQDAGKPGWDGATLNLLDYTAFNLPLRIEKSGGITSAAAANFYYDAGYQRVRQVKFDAANAQVDDILYVVPGGFEVRRNEAGQVKSSTATISGPDGSVATVTTNYDVGTGLATGGGSGINTSSPISGANTVTKLLLKDHLGSMVAEVTITGSVNAQGQVTAGTVAIVANTFNVHGFGPWGNARNLSSPLNGDNRGFTGHEHLAELGLIHMNGRIYDPVIGRFLQADPIIQAPQNAQSHNRYSYVMNNPLSFTDPSGFSSWTKFRDRFVRPLIGRMIGMMLCGPYCAAVGAGIASGGWRGGLVALGNTISPVIGAAIEAKLYGLNGRQFLQVLGANLIEGAGAASDNPWIQLGSSMASSCIRGNAHGGSCWVGARTVMISAGIQAAGTRAFQYLTSPAPSTANAPGGGTGASARRTELYPPAVYSSNEMYADDAPTRVITIPMDFRGSGSQSDENVTRAVSGIESYWSGSYEGEGKFVILIVKVYKSSDSNSNIMYLGTGEENPIYPGSNRGVWYQGSRGGFVPTDPVDRIGFVAAHEVGHLFSLGDRYLEGRGPMPNYDRNIMGAFDLWRVARPSFRDVSCIGRQNCN
jgi:RHS repeat-associated protein